jgi:hypothetical protein
MRDERCLQSYPLYSVATRSYPYQSGASMLPRPYAAVYLRTVSWEPRPLVECRYSRYVALWICGLATLG